MKLPLALGTPHKWFTWLDVITCFCRKLKVKSNLIQRVTTEFPYVGKLITSRMPRLCQVSQKWPVIFLWLLLMLDYINYYAQTQWGFWTCFASEIQCKVFKEKEACSVAFIGVCAVNCESEAQLFQRGTCLLQFLFRTADCDQPPLVLCFNRDASSRSAPGQTCAPKGQRCYGQSPWVSGWRRPSEQVHNFCL